jgi:hypothetical protein
LTADDSSSTLNIRNYNVGPDTLTRTNGALSTNLSYTGVTNFRLNASQAYDMVQLSGTAPNSSYTISVPFGSMNVGSTTAGLDTIKSDVTVLGGPAGTASIGVDDAASKAAATYYVYSDQVIRSSGTSSTSVRWHSFGSSDLLASQGADSIDVYSTAAGTQATVSAGAGPTTLHVGGTADNLDAIQGTLNVTGGSQTHVIVDDRNEPHVGGLDFLLVDAHTVSRDATDQVTNKEFRAVISYTPSIGSLEVDGGPYGNQFQVLSNPSVPTKLVGGAGSDFALSPNAV